jgi:exonuclease SbcD
LKLVHLSDLHLGFRQYERLTPTGINQREADVAGTFRRAIDLVIALRPEVVLIAGDVFHHVRPGNPAIIAAFRQFARLTASLPNVRIVMVAGNHDAPKTSETGCILKLFTELDRVYVVDHRPDRVDFPDLHLAILAVPDAIGSVDSVQFVPDSAFRYNVLLLHGEMQGLLPQQVGAADPSTVVLPLERLHAERWDYVALGHYHVYREIAPNAFYAGSLDYTSSNTWGELKEEARGRLSGKGFIERDLATGEHRFHHVAPARLFVDLSPITARGLTAVEIDSAIRSAVESCPGGIDDRVVRLVVSDLPRQVMRELDHKAIREYRRRALHFQLDARRPELSPRQSASGSPGRRPSIVEMVRAQLETRALEGDIDRDALVELGLNYMREAEMADRATPATAAILSSATEVEALDE